MTSRQAFTRIDVAGKREQLPPRLLPVLYVAFGHVCLALAFLAMALDPRAVAGFFYHSRMVAIVHLVTLGWISASILGVMYIVGPVALRMPLPVRRLDYWACGFTVTGIIGMVAHVWIVEFAGMAWSACLVAVGFACVGGKVWNALRGAPLPRAVKLHIQLAFFNILVAGVVGILLGLDKAWHFLPGFVLANVFAHAHLAAIGWASMMVVGVGYRLLPMVLPSAVPSGRSVYGSAVLLEAGVVGLFVTLVLRSGWTPVFGGLVVGGFLVFGAHVVWMRRHPRPAPPGLQRPDYGVWHVAVAFVYLALAAVLGLTLASVEASDWSLRAALVYGVFGLVGFLAQLVVGLEMRVLPMLAWYWAFSGTRFLGPVTSPYDMPERSFQRTIFLVWLVGVPALAAGFFFDAMLFLAAGAWLLLAGVALAGLNTVVVMRHAFSAPSPCLVETVPAR